MGMKVRFLNSIKNAAGTYTHTYGADDFNAITSCLIGSGVAPFPSKDTYTTNELNAMTEAVVNSGVSLDGLKVTFADNVIRVAQGIGFFTNGATIEVDSEGLTKTYTVTKTTYVYAYYDATFSLCNIAMSDTAPIETDTLFVVNLAEISAEGIVTDKRTFARSKVATLGRNVFYSVFSLSGPPRTVIETFAENSTIFEEALDLSKFNYLVSTWNSSSYNHYTRVPIEDLLTGESVLLITDWGSKKLAGQLVNGKLKIYVPDDPLPGYNGTEIFLC